jgi:hypothetical protein
VAYFEYGGPYFDDVRQWCEERWGQQYKNERWRCETNIGYERDLPNSYRPARITIKNERDAFDFKMRWV